MRAAAVAPVDRAPLRGATGWTSPDLDCLPLDGKRYEIVGGELFVAHQPTLGHQELSLRITLALREWNERLKVGEVYQVPGVVLAPDDDVIPDIVWISNKRLESGVDTAGHLSIAPELAIEVLSPGSANARRDRQAKVSLYSRRNVLEYWIADPYRRQVDVYRRQGQRLDLVETLGESDTLRSPLLPEFELALAGLFDNLRLGRFEIR